MYCARDIAIRALLAGAPVRGTDVVVADGRAIMKAAVNMKTDGALWEVSVRRLSPVPPPAPNRQGPTCTPS